MAAHRYEPRNITQALLLVFAEIDRYKYSEQRKFRRLLNTIEADHGEQAPTRPAAQDRLPLSQRQPTDEPA